jgi:Zn finger protein HypA/HybF involved in hydrogenase expression
MTQHAAELDPYTADDACFECQSCGSRTRSEERLHDCPSCGGRLKNIAIPRE